MLIQCANINVYVRMCFLHCLYALRSCNDTQKMDLLTAFFFQHANCCYGRAAGCQHRVNNEILSMGYNGFPIGCSDDEFPWEREGDTLKTKYPYVTHSELNAILNYRGGSLAGAKLYVTLFPCNECAKAIIQSGIREVIYDCDKYAETPSVRASKRMFRAAGVAYRPYSRSGRTVKL